MNNYHLYEEIGHGKFSIVYKGRKRHTIRYLAIKSVEKGRREKVATEVSIMSKLCHPNVVGFVNFYETRNHLWVISEYCAGGDLLHLLKQDGRLPESQVRLFGRDLCAGLLHVQARGVVYSDMKPANVLISEDGALKLSNFGHAQRLEDVARMLEEGAVLPRRGTPHYMAPELFQEGGMHSFASDLWAAGCVLHEMLTGRPPFHATSVPQIQEMILRDPLPLAADGSAELQAMLASLLRKAPLDRASWSAVRAHPFWEGRPPGEEEDADALPDQPQLPQLRRLWEGLAGEGAAHSEASSGAPSPAVRAAVGGAHANSHGLAGGRLATSSPQVGIAQVTGAADQAFAEVASPPWHHGAGGGSPEPTELGVELAHARTHEGAGAATAKAATAAAATAATAAVAATAAATPSAQQATLQQLACIGCTGEIDTTPAGLRARLGAETHARVQELVTVAETSVRPISRNHQIEEPEVLDTPTDLPFTPLSFEEVCSQRHADLEVFLMKVYKSIAQGPVEQKLGSLRYLELVCANMHVADLVVNSSLLRLVLRMLQAGRGCNTAKPGTASGYPVGNGAPLIQSSLRVRLLSLLGQLFRHVTYLEPSAAEQGLFDALLDGLGDREAAVRRRAAAAVGELLFYIATQPTPADAEAPASDWQVPEFVRESLVQFLIAHDADEVVQHYAVKTIENVATQQPSIAQEWFFSPQLVHALARHARRSGCDPFRLSCLSTVARLLRDCADAVDAVALLDPALVVVGVCDLVPHGIPHSLQLIATALLRASCLEHAAGAIPQNAVELLLGVASQPRYSSALRGRAVLLLTLLFVADDFQDARRLRAALDGAFVTNVDRLCREKDRFVVQCVAAAAAVMEVVAAGTLQSLVQSLRRLPELSKAAAADLGGALVPMLLALLHLVSSSMLCSCVLGARTLLLLGSACELTARLPKAMLLVGELQQLQPLILMVMEALSTQQALVLENAAQVVRCILPPLAGFLQGDRGDVRLLALKCFSGLCTVLLNDAHVFSPEADKPSETTRLLQTLLCHGTLPLLPALLADEPPAPSYALRLVATLLSSGANAAGAALAALRELGLARPLLEALGGQHGLTLHAAVLAHSLLHCREVEARDLLEAGVFDAVHEVLAEAADAAAAGSLAQIDFAMVDIALCITEEALAQAAEARQGQRPAMLAEVGPLAHALPVLAVLCAPLAGAGLAALLDRATACCERLASMGGGRGGARGDCAEPLSVENAACLLEALSAAAQWKQGAAVDPVASSNLQRRLLALLHWASAADAGGRVCAEVTAGVDRLLQTQVLAGDVAVVSDARNLVAATLGRGAAG